MTVSADLLSEHAGSLYRFALSITRDADLAGDLVQDTFVRAMERGDQYRGEAPLASWMRRILHNLAVDRGRRSGREIIVEEVEDSWRDDGYTVDPVQVAESTQTREEIEDALTRLPFIYRVAVVLHDIEGWTVREIADLQDIGLAAGKQRLRRGRMSLVTALTEGAERRKLLKGVPMRCWDARQHVSEYLDGSLDRSTAQLVEAHLEICPTCPPLYAALVGVRTQLGSLRDPNTVIQPDLEQRVRTAVSVELRSPRADNRDRPNVQ